MLESGPDAASQKWPPQDYADTSKPLFTVPINVRGRSLDELANQIINDYDNAESWRIPYDGNSAHYVFDSVQGNSDSIMSGLLEHVGVDLKNIRNQINDQGQALLLDEAGLIHLITGASTSQLLCSPDYIDSPSDLVELSSPTTIRRSEPTPAFQTEATRDSATI